MARPYRVLAIDPAIPHRGLARPAVHHRQTEVDCILFPIVEFALTPSARTSETRALLIDSVKEVEQGSRPLQRRNLDELVIEHTRERPKSGQ